MTIRGLLLRFSIAFVLVLVASALFFPFFSTKSLTTINTAALLPSTLYACMVFARENKRFLTRRERWQAWGGILGIDMLVQAALSLWLLVGSSGPTTTPPVQLVGSLVFIALLHGVLTLAFIAMAGKVFVQKSQTSA